MLRVRSSKRGLQHKALALAIGGSIALAFGGGAFAQAVNGTIRGTVPVAPNEAIQITGGSGYNRTITVGPSGQYSVTLPVGTYTVSLLQDGKVVQTRTDVTPTAAGNVAVDFAAAAGVQTLSTINVTANAIPAIDVTSTNQTSTFTAKQLTQLPLGRSTENVAMLAPGVTPGAAMIGGGELGNGLLVFSGSSVAENAYYIDGLNVTDALTGQGGIDLPYNSIEQAQIITTGYSAKYGRSIGGVINQIGKSGSNEWHFGARALWQPADWRSDPVNQLWNNPRYTGTGTQNPADAYGQLRAYNQGNRSAETIYDAYVSGPIIRNKLFFFLSAEQDNSDFNSVDPITTTTLNNITTQHAPKIYAKLNWNINENNILTLTGAQSELKDWTSTWDWDNTTHQTGAFNGLSPTNKTAARLWVANYTSYLSDNLTLHAMLGKSRVELFTQSPGFPGFDPTLPVVVAPDSQNPADVPPGGITNSNTTFRVGDPAHQVRIFNYRLSLDWVLGKHTLTAGIDNITSQDLDDGQIDTGPGYEWRYRIFDPNTPITGSDPTVAPYVAPPASTINGESGYVASKIIFSNQGSFRVVQRAAYLNDSWQITPNLLLDLGLRDDAFTNYNATGVPYIRLTKPQWEPRLGFSWDVHGDSTLKVYGNAGRYYLALPLGVALRGAGASIFTTQYFTYTGIDANGIPQGLTLIPENPSTGVSANNEYGQPLDPRTVTSQNIKAEYGDQFVLGMQQQLHFMGIKTVFGANLTYMKLGRIVDDWDDQQAQCAAGVREGLTWMTPQTCTQWTQGAVLINPAETQTILVATPSGGLAPLTVTMADQGFDRKVKRDYYALNLSLEHPWDGKWFASVDYTFSRDWGNTEGPVDSNIGQAGTSVSITEQWDFSQLMEWSYGLLPNNHEHQLKIYGAYAITPEWQLGGNLYVASGSPRVCIGYYGPDSTDPLGYNNAYHWCGGEPSPPGSLGNTPWVHELSLQVAYTPAWANRKLTFGLAVFNVFNSQTPTQYFYAYGTKDTPEPTYALVQGRTPPRTARFSITYNW